jgi:hypothetical protein
MKVSLLKLDVVGGRHPPIRKSRAKSSGRHFARIFPRSPHSWRFFQQSAVDCGEKPVMLN